MEEPRATARGGNTACAQGCFRVLDCRVSTGGHHSALDLCAHSPPTLLNHVPPTPVQGGKESGWTAHGMSGGPMTRQPRSAEVAEHIPQGRRGDFVFAARRLLPGVLLLGERGGAWCHHRPRHAHVHACAPWHARGWPAHCLEICRGSCVSTIPPCFTTDCGIPRATNLSNTGLRAALARDWRPC